MAEVLEEIGEVIEESSEGVEEEAAEDAGLTEEEEAEVRSEAAEASASVSKLGKVLDTLKQLNVPKLLTDFVEFVAKQAAIGAILFGVNVVLQKLFVKSPAGSDQKKQNEAKLHKVKALSLLITSLNTISNNLLKWLKEKQDVSVEIEDGISVPLPDIFSKYTKPIQTELTAAYDVSKQLILKNSAGKTNFAVPTTQQVSQIITSTQAFVNTLQEFVTFAAGKVSRFPELSSLTVTQADVDILKIHLNTVETLPYY